MQLELCKRNQGDEKLRKEAVLRCCNANEAELRVVGPLVHQAANIALTVLERQ